jgi:hypothetical protein
MPIKQKSTYKKQEYEYKSPDGEEYVITFVEYEDRKYISFLKDGEKDSTTLDWQMWKEVYEEVNKILNPSVIQMTGGKPKGIKAPKIMDRRGEMPGTVIDNTVQKTMERQDDSIRPIESFSPPKAVVDGFNYDIERSGISPDQIGQVGETPEDFKEGEWQKDAEQRKQKPREPHPNLIKGDESEQGGFRRANARKKVLPEDIL